MSLPNYVAETLGWLDTQANGGNFNTNNYSPAPVRINRDNSTRLDTGARTEDFDLTEANVVGVSSAPETTNTIIGTEFDYRVRAGVSVRVEAVHESEVFDDQNGGVTGDDDFLSLVKEVRRAILVEREWPTSDPGTMFLTIESENNNSASKRDYYRYDFDVWFVAHDDLPAPK